MSEYKARPYWAAAQKPAEPKGQPAQKDSTKASQAHRTAQHKGRSALKPAEPTGQPPEPKARPPQKPAEPTGRPAKSKPNLKGPQQPDVPPPAHMIVHAMPQEPAGPPPTHLMVDALNRRRSAEDQCMAL